jgi:hypothetical protein
VGWTKTDANTVKSVVSSYERPLRLTRPFLEKIFREQGQLEVYEKFCRLTHPDAGSSQYQFVVSAVKSHLCLLCKESILPKTARHVCAPCLETSFGKSESLRLRDLAYRKSLLANYGVSNISQLGSVKAKKVRNCLERYGVSNPQKALSVRRKTRATNRSRYGVSCTFQSPQVKLKSKATNLKRLGCAYPAQSAGVMRRRVQTNLERYGTEHAFQADSVKEKVRQTLLSRYGVENIAQHSESRKKAIKSMQSTCVVACGGRQFVCQGYERFAVKKLVKKFGAKDILSQFDEAFQPLKIGNRIYTPDFYIKSLDTYVDVKSIFTMFGKYTSTGFDMRSKNSELQHVCNDSRINLRFLVYAKKADCATVLPKDWHEQTSRRA